MNEEMTSSGKNALVRILPGCGVMWYVARLIRDSESMNLREILGDKLDHPDSQALVELMETCSQVNGPIDLEGAIAHFSGFGHLGKFDRVPTIVADELPEQDRAIAHTLLPLTLVGGEYRYENGDVSFPIRGLVQFGPSSGTPYAHLSSLVWLEDDGLSVRILEEQASSGVLDRARQTAMLDYNRAPRLQSATREAKEVLGM